MEIDSPLGNPLRVLLTTGQRHDSTQADAFLDGFTFEKVIADRGYAAAQFIAALQERGCEAVIPPAPAGQDQARVRYLALSGAACDRVLLSQTQACSPHVLPLREARSLFSRLPPLLLHAPLVTMHSNASWPGLCPGHEGEQPLAGHQCGGLAR